MKVGMLKNTATNRFHPILFHPSPFPGQPADPKIGSPLRYRSFGHHTEGFDTLELAQAYVMKEHPLYAVLDGIAEWNGEDIPAMTFFEPVHS